MAVGTEDSEMTDATEIGIEVTDSAYVAISMGVMTRVGTRVLQVLGETGEFVKVKVY